ncbi:MAG: hypothetical protein R2828_04305 [Saprospiraceae bacterium]
MREINQNGKGNFNDNFKINDNFNGACVAGAYPNPPLPLQLQSLPVPKKRNGNGACVAGACPKPPHPTHPIKTSSQTSITSQPPISPRPKKTQ